MSSLVLVRFSGGPLHGKQLWVEDTRQSLDVHSSDAETGVKRTLRYRKENTMFEYAGESESPLALRTEMPTT